MIATTAILARWLSRDKAPPLQRHHRHFVRDSARWRCALAPRLRRGRWRQPKQGV